MKGHPFVQLNTHSSDTFLLLCKAQAALSITPRRISRATNNWYKFRTATETAITGSRYNDTPVQIFGRLQENLGGDKDTRGIGSQPIVW